MSTVDREVVLEALSALTGFTVKTFSANSSFAEKSRLKSAKTLDAGPQLDIYNLITTALLGQNVVTTKAAVQSYSLRTDLSKEIFVNMDEFFDPRFDHDFTHLTDTSVCMRGNEPYKRPCGWNRIALKVLNKYTDGNTWLGTDGWRQDSVAGEWPVSYHGTSIEGAIGISGSSYKPGPGQVYGRGIYSTYDIEQASGYSKEFISKKTGKKYRVLMQNRINPQNRKVCDRKDYWLIEIPECTSPVKEREIVEKSIRPYGILLKQV
ncbi:hypothetical protein ABG768_018681 [Culter alburnus]|uniref:Uncharacterized protein n=1 Tax=Culter alburnus TaxID=194366 RepID=A0AAW2AXN5_CULAL